MGSVTPPANDTGSVRLRISVDKLSQLIEAGSLCATDFSCLDHQSKTTIQKLFLRFCLHGCPSHPAVQLCQSPPMSVQDRSVFRRIPSYCNED
jgi:hypothetical protein